MIGQKQVLSQIDNLIEKGFPRFVVITGQKGQGKTELAKYIGKKLDYPLIEFGIKIDEIREMIEMSYKQTEPIIYLIQYADKMSTGAKNSLLKVIEEPPNNAYFIMELQQIENTLDTIKSRCQELKMESYTEVEIDFMINTIDEQITDIDRAIIKKLAQNKYQIALLLEYNPVEFYNYVDKVYNNIHKVQSANSFKIAEKLDLKDTGEGYDLELFWRLYEELCMDKLISLKEGYDFDNNYDYNIISNCISITSVYLNKLNINGINKQSLVDMWILDIRKEWR